MTDNHIPTFVGEYEFLNRDVCDKIITEFRGNPLRHRYRPATETDVPDTGKQCWQVGYSPMGHPDCHRPFLHGLQEALNTYCEQYEWANRMDRFDLDNVYLLQQYEPGWAYHPFHFERQRAQDVRRTLVWTCYLNDVTDGGETEFLYQQLRVKPTAGKYAIWPAEWTHTHRGIPSPTQEKLILTGWFSFA